MFDGERRDQAGAKRDGPSTAASGHARAHGCSAPIASDDRRTGGRHVPRPRGPALVLDSRDARDAAHRVAHRSPRHDRLAIARSRAHVEGGEPSARLRVRRRLERSLRPVFWLTAASANEPGVWYAGGSPRTVPQRWTTATPGHAVSGWNDHPTGGGPVAREGTPDGSMLHSINVDPRDAHAPLHRPLGRRRVRERRRRQGLAAAERRLRRDVPSRSGAGVRARPALRPAASDATRPLVPAEPLRHLPHGARDGRWDRIGDNMPREVGDIGFPIELHPRDPDTAWVFPMDGTDVWPRTSPDGRPAVFVTRDAGESWTRCDGGLPERAWFTVKRQAMTVDDRDPVGVSRATSGAWRASMKARVARIAEHLPRSTRERGRVRSLSSARRERPHSDSAALVPDQLAVVDIDADTVESLFAELDRRDPGIRFPSSTNAVRCAGT